jgi:ribonuclease HI
MVDWICYTDGSVRKLPDEGNRKRFIGSWAFVMINTSTKTVIESAEAVHDTTISRMELMAVINVLRKIPSNASAKIYSDSQYVVFSANKWMKKWKRNNWTKDGEEPIKHVDLFMELDFLLSLSPKVEINWVRGHNGDIGNEYVDKIANRTSSAMKEGKPHVHYIERNL